MRIIAIDPGYDRCGVAIMEKINSSEQVLFSTCIESDKKQTVHARIYTVAERIKEYITLYSPTHLVIETLFFTNNQKTAMHVAEMRGVINFIGHDMGLVCYEYTPTQIKVAVTGSGAADKKQVFHMVSRLVSLPNTHARDDEYDAVAIGITHFAHTRP